MDFKQLGISEVLVKTMRAQGLVQPTPVQEWAIPFLLEGRDVVAQAQTGTGKTLAFVLPMLERIQPQETHVQALIVTPTRELAVQITGEVKKLTAALHDVNVLAVYGGQDVEHQLKQLKGATQIVVATPGRLLDHMRRETIDLSNVSMLVLDEADQMLHIGFLGEVEEIIRKTPEARQTALFSATMPGEVRKLAKRYMNAPKDVRIQSDEVTLKEIEQLVVETTDRAKQATLCALLDEYQPFLSIIFCRTKRRVSTLYGALKEKGYNADELHGDLSQAKREKAMKRFRNAEIQFLVATDVAARGLDVEGVTHVFNYDMPLDTESYIHRIGRTGRAGGKGIAVTLAALKDKQLLAEIEKGIDAKIPRKAVERAAEKKEEGSTARRGKNERQAARRKEEQRDRGDARGRERRSDSSFGRRDDRGSFARGKEEQGAPRDRNERARGSFSKERSEQQGAPRDRNEQRGHHSSGERAATGRGAKRNETSAWGTTRPGAAKSSRGRNSTAGQNRNRKR